MRRPLTFLVLSATLHLSALALLGLHHHGRHRDPPPEVLEVTLVEPPAPPPALPEPPPATHEAPARSGAVRPPRRPRAAPAPAETKPAPAPAPAETKPAPAPAPAETKPAPAPQLTPEMFDLSYEVMQSAVDMPVKEEVEPGDVDGMLAVYFDGLSAQAAAEQGRYDPALGELRREVESAWHPGFDEIHGGPLADVPAKMLGTWSKNAAHYGKTGSPIDPAGAPHVPDVPEAGILDVKEQAEKSGAFTKTVALAVTVHFDGEGGFQIGHVERSGHPRFDESALDALGDALSRTDALPAEKTRATWLMEADFSIAPPLPVAGFGFDLALQHFELGYPLKKSVDHRLTLVAVHVEDGAAD
jgi:hypothetical protein